MKKTPLAIAIVGVLAVAYVGSTWYIGTKIESRLDQEITRLNTRLATEFALNGLENPPYLEKLSYDRGVFSSHATYAVGLRGQEGRLQLNDEISHGPLPWGALSHGMFAPAMAFSTLTVTPSPDDAEKVKALFNNQTPFVGYTRLNFGETVNFDWRIAAINTTQDETSVDFAGMDLVGSASLDGKDWDAKGGSAGLKISSSKPDDHFTLSFGKLSYEIKTQRSEFDVGLGQSQVSVADFALRDIGDRPEQLVSVKRIDIQSTLALDSKTSIGADMTYRIDGLNVDQAQLGDINLNVRVSRVDGPSVKALTAAYQEQVDSGKLKNLSDPTELLAIPGFQENIIGLLKQNPQLIATLDATNSAGKSNLEVTVDTAAALDPARPGPEILKRAQAALTLDPAMVALAYEQALVLNGESAEAAKQEVADTLQDVLDSMVEDGALIRNDQGKYVATVAFENGELTFNSEAIPPFMIPLLFGMLMSGLDTDLSGGQAPELEEFRFEEEAPMPRLQ